MRRAPRMLPAAAAALALALVVATPALAAEAPSVTPSFEDIQIWADTTPGTTALIVVAQLPTAAPLPAIVHIPLPQGAKVTWAGELSGGGPQSDVQRPSTNVAGTGGQVVVFTTQKSRVVQYEADLPAPASASGGVRTVSMRWVQSASADEIDFAYKFPAGTTSVQTDPPYFGQPETNTAGESLYPLATRKLTLGAVYETNAKYVLGAATAVTLPEATTSAKTATIDPVVAVLIVLLVLVLVALVVAWRRGRRTPAGGEPDDVGSPADRGTDDVPGDDTGEGDEPDDRGEGSGDR